MSRDDMHVIMCKIIAYLYACMKAGEKPDPAQIRHDSDMLHINERYWAHIMQMLHENGFVTGITLMKTFEGATIVFLDDPMVTLQGVEFMHENSTMRKAISFLRDNPEALPKAVVTLIKTLLI